MLESTGARLPDSCGDQRMFRQHVFEIDFTRCDPTILTKIPAYDLPVPDIMHVVHVGQGRRVFRQYDFTSCLEGKGAASTEK